MFYTGPAPGRRPNTVAQQGQQVQPLWKTCSTAEFALRQPPISRATSAPGVLRDENGRLTVSKDCRVPLKWYNGKPMSLSQDSFVDFTPLRAVAKPHKTPVDFQADETWKRALGDHVPMNSNSLSKEVFRDYSGHRDALRPSPTVYTQKEELRKIRMSMELKQRQQRKTGRGLRPPGQTCNDEFKFFTAEDLKHAKQTPCFTSWHEQILPQSSPEVWSLSKDSSMYSSLGDARLSPCKQRKNSPRRHLSPRGMRR